MKISLSTHQFFDDEGRPLASGRITVYLHGSDTPADLYTMEGDEYVQADNPVTCYEDGRIPTLFFEASVVDVKVEKSNLDGTYELLDTYEDGFDFASAKNDTVVYDIDSLHEANTEVGVVSVVGYDSEVYGPQRTYVWDPTCTELADDGVIVESNTTDTGRWILLWDDEKLPCTVYGIMPGKEANISAFLTYPDFVGQWSIRTPRIPRFLSGTYTSDTTFTTSRTIYFDEGARFVSANFFCEYALIPVNSGYVADFNFTGAVPHDVHSSWFRHASWFVTCKGQRFVVDKVNYFTDSRLTGLSTFDNAEVVFHGRLPVTYVNSGRLKFNRCAIVGSPMFTHDDLIDFAYMEIHDEWWQQPANIDWVTNVHARSTSLNTLLLANFKNVVAYVNAVRANGATVLDLAGREISSLDANGFTEVRNTVCNTVSFSNSQSDFTLRNVRVGNAIVTCRYLTVAGGSDVAFNNEPSFSAMWVEDSRVSALTDWTAGHQVIARRSVFDISLKYASENENDHSYVELTDCTVAENRTFALKRIVMNGCTLTNNSVRIYPTLSDGVYRLNGSFSSNRFNGNSYVEFTKVDIIGGYAQDDVHSCIVNWKFAGNEFNTSDQGIRCRYWQNRAGGNYNITFIAFSNDNVVEYHGNTGKCPAETARGMSMNNGTGCEAYFYWLELGDDTYATLDKHRQGPVFPSLKANGSPYHWNLTAIDGNGFAVVWKYTGNDGAPLDVAQGCFIYPWAHLNEPVNNGSLFDAGFTKFGKIEEATPSYYPYHWQYGV